MQHFGVELFEDLFSVKAYLLLFQASGRLSWFSSQLSVSSRRCLVAFGRVLKVVMLHKAS
uniref:Uncharacterized protein n=1 Tax=Brassica oleracea var. oleracea TaxID=109376 RepID=A0A0D3B9M7_BRAOL